MTDYYDLFVLLDPEAPEERRAAIVDQVKSQIDAGGASLKGDADWGMRRLSYEIDHRREAQYHLFQFAGTADVLTQLHRSLSIDDSVLRHRIIRLPKEPEATPTAPEDAPRRTSDERGGSRDRRDRDTAPEGDTAEPSSPATEPEAPLVEPEAPAAAIEAPAPAAAGEEPSPPEAAAETGAETGEAAPAQEPDGAA
jgi:small subunit ribosomal protein S6